MCHLSAPVLTEVSLGGGIGEAALRNDIAVKFMSRVIRGIGNVFPFTDVFFR